MRPVAKNSPSSHLDRGEDRRRPGSDEDPGARGSCHPRRSPRFAVPPSIRTIAQPSGRGRSILTTPERQAEGPDACPRSGRVRHPRPSLACCTRLLRAFGHIRGRHRQQCAPVTKRSDMVQDEITKAGVKRPRVDQAGTRKYAGDVPVPQLGRVRRKGPIAQGNTAGPATVFVGDFNSLICRLNPDLSRLASLRGRRWPATCSQIARSSVSEVGRRAVGVRAGGLRASLEVAR